MSANVWSFLNCAFHPSLLKVYSMDIPILDLDQLFHSFQPSFPTDETGLHQRRTFNCERNISQAPTQTSMKKDKLG